MSSPASAHDEESDQASVLVLQAIALIIDMPEDMEGINDKINDALEAPDTEGVNLDQVRAAKEAMDSGNLDQVRSLLQQCLSTEGMLPAVGEETGTTVVHDPLDTRGQQSMADWVILAISVLVMALGGWLAVRYRPAQGVRALRRLLTTAPSSSIPTHES